MAASAQAAVPSVPLASLQAVQDPQARTVLRALADMMAVRNGEIGSGDNAFLTLADLKGNSGKLTAVANRVAGAIADGAGKPGSSLQALADALQQQILQSAAWQSMFKRIALIGSPASVPGSFANQLAEEAKSQGAALKKATEINVTPAQAEILQSEGSVVDVAGAIAGIVYQAEQRSNKDNALAQAINTMWVEMGDGAALIQDGDLAAVNPTGSVASKWRQIQSAVTDSDGNVISSAAMREDIDTAASDITGLQGKWGVSMDLSTQGKAYVTGVSLNGTVSPGGVASSSFIIVADKFAIGAPGKPETVPFAIDATSGIVSLKGSLIADGTIQGRHIAAYAVGSAEIALKAVGGAQIDDLAVDTLKIAGNAVITGVFDEAFDIYVPNNGEIVLNSRTVDLGDAYNSGLIVHGTVYCTSTNDEAIGFKVLIDGAVYGDQRASMRSGYGTLFPVSGFGKPAGRFAVVKIIAYDPAGTSGGNFRILRSTMSVMGGKR